MNLNGIDNTAVQTVMNSINQAKLFHSSYYLNIFYRALVMTQKQRFLSLWFERVKITDAGRSTCNYVLPLMKYIQHSLHWNHLHKS